MARKHKRRTRKRNKKGGFLGPTMKGKFTDGLRGLDDLRKGAQERAKIGMEGAKKAASDVHSGYNTRVTDAGSLPKPPTSYVNPEIVRDVSLTPPSIAPPIDPTKEKKGGLLGLGTWFGLGGRRLSHSSFINKMLRVRSKTKRNKALRKYLKGGKKKTKKHKTKKKGRKNKTKKRRRRRR